MKRLLACVLAALSTSAIAATNPVTVPSKLDSKWQAKTRAMLEQAIEIPTVMKRGNMLKMTELVAIELKAAGIPAEDIKILEHEGLPGDKTATLIARWRADKPTRKPMLILGHMDVVEAKREDWTFDPFEFREQHALGNNAGVRRRIVGRHHADGTAR